MKRFIEGRETVKDDDRYGCPLNVSTETNVSQVEQFVMKDRGVTIREIAVDLSMSYGTVQEILTSKLKVRRVCARWVPRLLLPEQMKMRHSSSPSPLKERVTRSAGKIMLIFFCDINGIILNHIVPPKTSVTGDNYARVIKSDLMRAVKRKRPDLIRAGFTLHQDNAPNHESLVVMDTMETLGIEKLTHPPYSPDLAICDFWLFPVLKDNLRGEKYESQEDLGTVVNKALRSMSRDGLDDVFRAWADRWQKCIKARGAYFENE
ncbi:histone-lysine N-methyltransferase SETMAR-like [Saccostrea echinata]|uniref:histone-lysine N-methyltransferase SETMAR-like n=1 Tax=Saccostrea echinata TaxID=191078 RepID=UPI002A8143B2|nr:histone-lysine N-methyltransferase SETMAR-like [Saccostrea echinata]